MAKRTRKEIDDDRLAEAKRKNSVMCKCTNRVPYEVFNKKGWAVCKHCGRKILKPQDEFKNKLLSMLGSDKQ